jgi:filamin
MPIDHGKHTVNITLNGAPVAKSPYTVQISKPSGYPDAMTSYAEGPGLRGGNTAEPATFKIFAKDSNGNPVNMRENPFVVDIVNPDGTETTPKVTNNNDGTWDVVYEPKQVGMHEVTVGLKNPAAPVYFDHLKDSPFKVNIVPGCDASKTKVYGPGIEDGVQDNLPTHFTIEARDTNGNPMGKGGDPFEVKIAGPRGNVPAEVVDNGDGTYTVNFAPDDAGKHKIDVTLKGKDVANAPYTINVREGADHNTSCVEMCEFTIRAKTKRGAFMNIGGEKFGSSIKGPKGEVEVDVKDNGNGSYHVSYPAPTDKGEYTFRAYVKQLLLKKDIKNSPWTEVHQ